MLCKATPRCNFFSFETKDEFVTFLEGSICWMFENCPLTLDVLATGHIVTGQSSCTYEWGEYKFQKHV